MGTLTNVSSIEQIPVAESTNINQPQDTAPEAVAVKPHDCFLFFLGICGP
jgi:hypothetical protein